MALSDSERRILQQLEQSFESDTLRVGRIVRSERRRRVFAAVAAPLGLLGGIALVFVGVLTGHRPGVALGVLAFIVVVLSARLAVTVLQRARASGRGRTRLRPLRRPGPTGHGDTGHARPGHPAG